jgi:cobalt-zinc-cadmium resistance protein CzcA
MLQRIVGSALQYRAVVAILAGVLVVAGLLSFRVLPIEAYPNPVPPMVEIIAQPPGWSAEETERYITIPIELGLAGMPGLDHVRSQSLFGLADVKLYFKWGIQYKDARQEVINRLQFIQLPSGVQAQLSPWNATGEIFRYRLVDRDYENKKKQIEAETSDPKEREERLKGPREESLLKLKTLEDWTLEREW